MHEPKFWQNTMLIAGVIALIGAVIIISLIIAFVKNKKKRQNKPLIMPLTIEELQNTIDDSFDALFKSWFQTNQKAIAKQIETATRVDLAEYIVIPENMFKGKYKVLLSRSVGLREALQNVFPNVDVTIKAVSQNPPYTMDQKFEFEISWYRKYNAFADKEETVAKDND